MNLVYIADPMCSWCYGFGKELSALRQALPNLPLQIVGGGVRAGETSVMTDEMRQFRLSHWARVEKTSGLPFNRAAFLARQNFVYDTEPVCRAVVATRKMAPTVDQLGIFRAIQSAFYVDGLDTTKGEVLAAVAAAAMTRAGVTTDAANFLTVWKATETIAETQADFLQARKWGVSSFPSLLLNIDGKLHSVSPGYTSAENLKVRLQELLGEASATPAAASAPSH